MTASVLLVEDDEPARLVIGDILNVAGYDVRVAATGQEAIDAINRFAFDVVISDIRLPDIDGIEVVQVAMNQTLPPSVLLLTGYGTLDTAIAALRVGACEYLLKPCSSDVLLTSLRNALQRRNVAVRQADTLRALAHGVAQLQEKISTISPIETMSTVSQTVADADEPDEMLHVGRLHVGRLVYEAHYNHHPLHLTPIEHALLRCLAEAQGDVVPYSELVNYTHRYTVSDVEAQMLLKSHVRNIRRKTSMDLIVNVRHVGYRLVEDEEELLVQDGS